MMQIKQFRYFIEVYQQVSFSRASEKLGISQPALSKVIAQLEEELELQLFDRSTRQLQITAEGEAMYEYAQKVIREVEDFKQAAVDLRTKHKGHFRFGLPPVIGSSFFPKVISAFQKQYPDAKMGIVEEGARVVQQSILHGELDVGIGILPIPDTELEVIPIVKRKLLLVVSNEHPLADAKKVKMSELKGEHFLLFKRGFSLYDRVREASIDSGFEPNVIHESTQWDFLLKMVKENLGVSFLPETIVEDSNQTGIRAIEVDHPLIHWNLALISRKNGYQSPATTAWIDYVKAYFKEETEY
ncbi:DNA-binding transcriptional LysR family regulator [Geomicrobium sediminis]|uniref:DNA-binding transcriptional LysR family regulator n=2 Tax=Geomicrobium sediminis TaxID=1347788 RepID=A0ABS2PFZ6_9BACL|nr:DNA-binding transcriptional LysR family regulator [Geomicrobium sediminis]